VAQRWRASRLDVTEGTAVGHQVQLARVFPTLGTLRVGEITTADVPELVTGLHAEGRERETIRKSVTVLAQVLDFAGIKDNSARDRVHLRLPREERDEPTPPTADQIEAVLSLMPHLGPADSRRSKAPRLVEPDRPFRSCLTIPGVRPGDVSASVSSGGAPRGGTPRPNATHMTPTNHRV
jgi:hypothetical protein